VDGLDGKDGINGTNGVDGLDGKDGINGTNGVDGKDGKNGINGTNGVWDASATYTGGTLMSPTIVAPTISAAVLTLQNPGGTTSLFLDHYEYFRSTSVQAKVNGAVVLGTISCTFVRVGRLVTMYYGPMNSPNQGADGSYISVQMSQAQFPARFRPPGNPFYSVPVISNSANILGSVVVQASGELIFWAGAPYTAFTQTNPNTAGWPDSAIS
jgi:hypothetical protein